MPTDAISQLPGTLLKERRLQLGKSQKELAEQIQVTPGFITKIEAGEALPSFERCVQLAQSLAFPIETLLAAVENAREEQAQQRRRIRGAVWRDALGARSTPLSPSTRGTAESAAQQEVHEAHRLLDMALANQDFRPKVLELLKALCNVIEPASPDTTAPRSTNAPLESPTRE